MYTNRLYFSLSNPPLQKKVQCKYQVHSGGFFPVTKTKYFVFCVNFLKIIRLTVFKIRKIPVFKLLDIIVLFRSMQVFAVPHTWLNSRAVFLSTFSTISFSIHVEKAGERGKFWKPKFLTLQYYLQNEPQEDFFFFFVEVRWCWNLMVRLWKKQKQKQNQPSNQQQQQLQQNSEQLSLLHSTMVLPFRKVNPSAFGNVSHLN